MKPYIPGPSDKELAEKVTCRKIDWDTPLTIQAVSEAIEKVTDAQEVFCKQIIFIEEYDHEILPDVIKTAIKVKLIDKVHDCSIVKESLNCIIELYRQLDRIEALPKKSPIQ